MSQTTDLICACNKLVVAKDYELKLAHERIAELELQIRMLKGEAIYSHPAPVTPVKVSYESA